jgi:signal transduction histidine kinase
MPVTPSEAAIKTAPPLPLGAGTGPLPIELAGQVRLEAAPVELPTPFGVCEDKALTTSEPERVKRRFRILLVEDNDNDAELMVAELQRLGFDIEWQTVETEEAFLGRLNSGIDLILSDYALPAFSGMRALELLNEHKELDIPFIIVSGTIGEETAVTAIKNGASDYLLKDRIARLGPAVHRALREVEERRERKRLQAQFLEAQKMEVIGQLAAGVAHDFNNVLAVIMGYADLIATDIDANHPAQKYADEIRHAAKRAAGLTRQLLIFSRKEAVQNEPVDLNEVVTSMQTMLRRLVDENIEMVITCGKDLGDIRADSGYIWQVLMNLVVNARDAMPAGGRITIKSASAVVDADTPQVPPDAPHGDYVVLSVSDTGIGMNAETMARLFEPFYTTKPAGKGTGLGLVTCQTIMRQSNGFIGVTSEQGVGTTFKAYFPKLGAGEPGRTQPALEPQPPSKGTETLLIVEDEPSVRMLAQGVLVSQGYDVLIALNGQDALRVARDHVGPPIALVVSDVVMPRMGGKAMAEWLRTVQPDLKILFTSGYTEEAILDQTGFDKGVEFLPKPYTPAALIRTVREMLDEK